MARRNSEQAETIPLRGFRPAFLRSDLGNAERFVAMHGENVRYLPAWKRWIIFDGKCWRVDETLDVHRRAKEAVRAIWREIEKIAYEERAAWAKHTLQSETDSRIRAMLQRAMAEPGIAITPNQLDADPWLLGVDNGVLDLRTAKLRPHDRTLLMTKISPASYEESAQCPRWLRFLDEVFLGDADRVAFVQRFVGYSLTGDQREHCLALCYGSGANGKSTFFDVLRALLGDYAKVADFGTFLERRGDGPRNDIAQLRGARAVTSSEAGEDKRFDESLVKALTGESTITARRLYAEADEFDVTFKIWLATNHRPVIRGTDEGMWRRIRLIPFDAHFDEGKRDPELKARLRAELPGILAWAVQGCQLWLESGLGTSTEVERATQEYRRDSDVLGAFLEECCELGPDFRETVNALYTAYQRWALRNGMRAMTSTAFGRRLNDRAIGHGRQAGTGRTLRLGVRLLADAMRSDRTTDVREQYEEF